LPQHLNGDWYVGEEEEEEEDKEEKKVEGSVVYDSTKAIIDDLEKLLKRIKYKLRRRSENTRTLCTLFFT